MAITSGEWKLRANGVSQAPTVAVTGGFTGQFESTDSSSFNDSDQVNYLEDTTGGSVGTLTISHIGCKITNTDPEDVDSGASVT